MSTPNPSQDPKPTTDTLLRGCIGWLHSMPESQKPDPAWMAPLYEWLKDNRT